MSKATPARRRKVSPIAAAALAPVLKRLARMEALLIEVRHEQDVKLKRIKAIHLEVETLTEQVRAHGARMRRLSRLQK
jgi:hypothetical protein